MNRNTIWAAAAIAAAAALPLAAAHGQSLGDMATDASDSLDAVGPLLSIFFYIIGAAITGFGLLKFKRHVDNPQQVSLANCFVTVAVGAGLIFSPFVINSVAGTFGGEGTQVERPTFQ